MLLPPFLPTWPSQLDVNPDVNDRLGPAFVLLPGGRCPSVLRMVVPIVPGNSLPTPETVVPALLVPLAMNTDSSLLLRLTFVVPSLECVMFTRLVRPT